MNDEDWSGERVARWLRQAEGLERQLAPVSDILFATARLGAGERVLDVGCGAGPTTRRAAVEVGPTGSVTGLDVAADMLVAAAAVDVGPDAAPIDWVEADVVTWSSPTPDHDVVLSRFGVMFFSDPQAAFANLCGAARPGGRLCIAVWNHRDRSDLFSVPLRAAVDVLRQRGVAADVPPPDAGAYSLGDPDGTADLLAAAGWDDVEVHEHHVPLAFSGGVGPADAARASLDFGPTRMVTTGLEDADRDAVEDAIAVRFADHVDAAGHVVLHGRVLVAAARRP